MLPTFELDPPLTVPPGSTARIEIDGEWIRVAIVPDDVDGEPLEERLYRRKPGDPTLYLLVKP